MYSYKILENVESDKWNSLLLKTKSSTFFQTVEYLRSNSSLNRFPLFVYIYNEKNEVKGQLGLKIIKSKTGSTNIIFKKMVESGNKLGNRASWVSGPIIHSENMNERKMILQEIFNALEDISKKNNLMILDGYSPPQDYLIDSDYKKSFKDNGYNIQNFLTLSSELEENIEVIWKKIKKNARNDVTKAKRENIQIKEILDQKMLEEHRHLTIKWAKTKGISAKDSFENLGEDWNLIKSGIEKIFVAYKDDHMVAALRIGCFNNIAYTHQVLNAYSESGNVAGPLLTWYVIEWAKNNGIKIYDFSGGEAPARKNDKRYSEQWDSLFAYKRKWGGNEFPYYHFIKINNKIKYKISRILAKPDWYLRNYKRKHYSRKDRK